MIAAAQSIALQLYSFDFRNSYSERKFYVWEEVSLLYTSFSYPSILHNVTWFQIKNKIMFGDTIT